MRASAQCIEFYMLLYEKDGFQYPPVFVVLEENVVDEYFDIKDAIVSVGSSPF